MRLEYFQMIDRIESFDADAHTVSATARVPMESTIFEGHFPGHPLMPGVLLIETMAQASGFLLLALNQFTRMPFFAGVKKGKLRDFVKPGTALSIGASLLHDGSGFAVTEAEIKVDGRPTCDAELTFTLVPFQSAEFESAIRARAADIGLADLVGQKA